MQRLFVLWLVVFISLMGFGVTTVPFPFVAEQMGASDFWKTFGGAGVFSLMQLISTPIWGRYSDAVGRKPILLWSLAGSVLAYVWLAYADDLVSLLLARALGGVMSGNLAAAFAYASDVTDPKNRARGIGIITSAFGVGFAIGPALGGWLGTLGAGEASLHWPALVSAALCVVALVGTALFLQESLPVAARRPMGRARAAAAGSAADAAAGAEPIGAATAAPTAGVAATPGRSGPSPVLLSLMSIALIVGVAGSAMQSAYVFWGRDLFGFSLADMGLQFALFAVFSALGQASLVGPLVRRFGERGVALIATVGTMIGLLMFATAAHEAMVWATMMVFGLSLGLFSPAVTSLVSFEASAGNRGAVMGQFNAAQSAGRIVGPAAAGPVYFSLGHSSPFLASALLTLVALVLLWRLPARGLATRH